MIHNATWRVRAGRMSLWRLEWLRLIRTPRALTLAAAFVFFGLLEPALTRYQSQILGHVGNGVRISFPPATPAQGVSSYAGELSGIGLIVLHRQPASISPAELVNSLACGPARPGMLRCHLDRI
jgi:hypothetical protein